MNLAKQRWFRQMMADKKKFSIMVVLFVVLLVLTVRVVLSGDPRSANASSADGDDAAQSGVAQDRALKEVFVDLPDNLSRDLFALDPKVFPPAPPKDDGTAKSGDKPADEPVEQKVRRLAQQLQLQTTVAGSRPRALINGRMVGPGETIEGFTLKHVGHREVTVEMQGVVVQLGM